jgi:hypothetical protein
MGDASVQFIGKSIPFLLLSRMIEVADGEVIQLPF